MNLQYLIARWTGRLPRAALIRLSGEPPLVADGRQFDPHAQFLRAMRRRRGVRGLVEPSVEAGRKRYRIETRIFRGPATEVGAVRDFEIDRLRVRHYAPVGGARDVTVYLHGGGFTIGDLDTHDEPCRILCRHASVHVLSFDYRLAPEHPFPAALDDTRAALRWTQANAATLGADPQRVSIGGDSAGANLATVTARLFARDGAPPIAQLLIYPTTDGAVHYRSYDLFGEGHFLTMNDRAAFTRCYTHGATITDLSLVSPLHAPDLHALPPALVVTAGFDLLRDEGDAYAAALARAGNVVRRHPVPTLGHGFIHMTGVNRAAREAMVGIAREWRALLGTIPDFPAARPRIFDGVP